MRPTQALATIVPWARNVPYFSAHQAQPEKYQPSHTLLPTDITLGPNSRPESLGSTNATWSHPYYHDSMASYQGNHVVHISLHKYRYRCYAAPAGAEHAHRTHACKRYPVSRKQLKWLTSKNLLQRRPNSTKCYELSVSASKHKTINFGLRTKCAKTPTVDEDFFVYRDYLYFEKEIRYLVVNVKNAY